MQTTPDNATAPKSPSRTRALLGDLWAPIACVAIVLSCAAVIVVSIGLPGRVVEPEALAEIRTPAPAPTPCCSVPVDQGRAAANAAETFRRLGAELDGEILCAADADSPRVECSALVSGHIITLSCADAGCWP